MGLNALRRYLPLRHLQRAVRLWQGFSLAHPTPLLPEPLKPYAAWQHWNRPSAVRTRLLNQALAALPQRPHFSVLLPIVDEGVPLLDETSASLLQQIYPDWTLLIVAGGSAAARIQAGWVDRDPRIRLLHQPAICSIARATNHAADAAQGDYFVLLAPGDRLTTEALAQVALYLATHGQCDWLYSDESSISATQVDYAPRFKPDWSPEYLLACAYVGDLLVIRAELWRKLGGMPWPTLSPDVVCLAPLRNQHGRRRSKSPPMPRSFLMRGQVSPFSSLPAINTLCCKRVSSRCTKQPTQITVSISSITNRMMLTPCTTSLPFKRRSSSMGVPLLSGVSPIRGSGSTSPTSIMLRPRVLPKNICSFSTTMWWSSIPGG